MSTYGVDFQDCGNIIPPEQVMYFYLEHEALEAWADENARAVISMALDMCPGVGDIKNGIEFFAQKDLITGQKLTAFDYAMMIVPTAILRHTPSGIRKIVGRLPGGKYADDIAETAESVAKHVDEVAEVGKSGSNTFGNYSTKIDSKVTVVEKKELPSWLIDTYKDGVYRTVVTNEDITVYRSFGYNAEAGGAFATSSPAVNRIQTKFDSAILPEWKNTLRYEAEIVIPKGTTLNIGRVGEQFTMSGTRLAGDADQFLLPQNWDLNWIKSIREVKP